MNSKQMLIGSAIAGILAIIRLIIQGRQVREAAAAKLASDEALAKLRRETEERAARQAREAMERAQDREQKEKLITQIQLQTERTLAIMESQLRVRDAASDRSFEYLDRNTRATEKLAEASLEHAKELSEIRAQVAAISAGAACRAGLGERRTV